MKLNSSSPVLVTGAAGFIGWRTAQALLDAGQVVIGVDNLNDYYDVRLKKYRLKSLRKYPNFHFAKMDIENYSGLKNLFIAWRFGAVINLAARAGVRYSLENPFVYARTNTIGALNLLELCREYGVKKFVLASTSSLYTDGRIPSSESAKTDAPISPYAASKKGAEAMSYAYSFLYGMDVTVLRYFTVYGPCGRPDMSPFRFIEWIETGKPLLLNGDGSQSRDFTYVDDIARGTVAALGLKGYHLINLGGNRPHNLNRVIELMESCLGRKAKIKRMPFHKADLKDTWADISLANKQLKWRPETSIEEGIRLTVKWHRANRKLAASVKL